MFTGTRVPYSKSLPVPAPFLNQPVTETPTRGVYAAAFPSKPQDPAMASSLYPQGDGFASLVLGRTGSASLRGYLADGTKFSGSARLREDGTIAPYSLLYRKRGAFGGQLGFGDLEDTDVSGFDLQWIRRPLPTARPYPGGWPDGIVVDAAGTKHAHPASLDFGQGLADIFIGNGTLSVTGGLLSRDLDFPVSVDPSRVAPPGFRAPPRPTPSPASLPPEAFQGPSSTPTEPGGSSAAPS